jgi:diguanylate cyclase (GGDEF)-like protein/PAS domain S-box-containing protein
LSLLHGVADLALMLASLLIAALLLYLYLRRPDLRLRRLFALFALFILGNGASHLSYWAWSFGGSHWLLGTLDAGVAVIAVLTAGCLLRGMPQALRMPGEAMLEQANARLEAEIAERCRAEADLTALNELLEQRVGERTAALEAANAELKREIGEREHVETALRASQDQLRVALESARMGVWEWDIPRGAMHWSERVAALFGLALEQFDGTLQSAMRLIHPDDRERVQADLDACFQGVSPHFALEYRVVRQDGKVRWLEARGRLYRDESGAPVRMAGLTTDVTDQKLSELALAESEQRYRTLVEHAPEAIVVLDASTGRFTDANENAVKMFGLPRDALLALGPMDLSAPVQPDGRAAEEAAREHIQAALRGEAPVFEWVHRNAADEDIVCEVRLVRLFATGRDLVRGSMLDITERKRIEAALRESETKFATVFRICPESISISTMDDGVYVDVNEAYERVFGYARERVIGRSALDLGIWVDALERQALLHELRRHGRVENFEARIRRVDGELRTGQMSAEVVDIDGRTYLVIVLRDITELKVQEDELRLAARVFDSTAEGIMITDPRSRIITVNPAFTELTGYSEDAVRGRQPSVLGSGRHERRFFEEMWASIHRSGRWHGEVWNRTRTGEERPFLLTITTLSDERGTVLNYVGVMRDISTIKQSQQQLEYLANYDGLTGLGNRNLFYTRLKVGIEKAARHRRNLAVVFIDLDNFKVINDTLGHDVGDVLLSEVARRIKICVRQEDVVCRLGGDEFTVYVEDFDEPQALVGTAQRLTQTVSEPYHIAGQEIFVTASVGISIYPNDGATMSELLKNADTAMYKAKEQGKNGFQFFREDMNARAFERLVFVSGLRRALDRGEFRLVYQPQVELADRRIRGAECLLRWSHPDMGEVSPGSFIPVAEETGLIVPIGEWVFGEAGRQLREWGRSSVCLSVNVSARQFRQAELVELIRRTLDESGLGPELLSVEITESALIDDPENAAATLSRLKDMGLTIALDDFGTGYSSLSYLKRFPIDSLKIDRTFVRDIVADPDDAAIVTAIITMAHSLKVDVVAEGVETQQQVDFLRARGCHAAQGHFFSKPLPAERMEEWLGRGPLPSPSPVVLAVARDAS